jgi:hypothetical protein
LNIRNKIAHHEDEDTPNDDALRASTRSGELPRCVRMGRQLVLHHASVIDDNELLGIRYLFPGIVHVCICVSLQSTLGGGNGERAGVEERPTRQSANSQGP